VVAGVPAVEVPVVVSAEAQGSALAGLMAEVSEPARPDPDLFRVCRRMYPDLLLVYRRMHLAPDYPMDLHPDYLMRRCRKRPGTTLVVSIALRPG